MLKIELAAIKPGQSALITAIEAEASLEQRLLALGFRAGRKITMLRCSPFNGPIHVRVGTTEVMLRRRDAKSIQLIEISNQTSEQTSEAPK
ncbi:FeoA family protein [Rivularia sp. IAM M-261]|nr:FeoA family protein [Calothrix sp. PCC 7716]GJD18697.1 FeoA family protein [Rivularia sp. IAM M-261]